MDHSLHMWVNPDHPLIQVWKLIHQNLRIKSHCHKESANTALNWHQENITNLQTHQKREGHHHRRITPIRIVFRLGESDVKVSEE